MTKKCVSCGFKIPNGEERECYNHKTGKKIYFCKFCDPIFRKFGAGAPKEAEDD